MKIRTKNWLATIATLGTICLIAAAIGLSAVEVLDASRQRRQTTEILRYYTQLRLVSFEYLQGRSDRARAQWYAVSEHIDALIANNHFREPEHAAILAGLRARRVNAPRIFAELTATRNQDFANAALRERYEAQLSSRLLIDSQDSVGDAFALTALANQRIEVAQNKVMLVVAGGLTVLVLVIAGQSFLIHRNLLEPIVRLQRLTREVASGNLSLRLELAGDDEITDLSRDFDAMTQSLCESFAKVESSNRHLTTLNKELEAFGYSVSHDLRAPLRSIDGFSLALLEDHSDQLSQDGLDALQRIRAASQHMDGLIDDLLRLSRVTRTELELAEVNISAMARAIATQIDRDDVEHRVQWVIEPNLQAKADTALLRIAMQNLMHNGWKFTRGVSQPTVRVSASSYQGKKVFSIADNGAGFDMAYADRLFGVFQRLHPAEQFPGTGIGLAIVQRIVNRHGGEIWAMGKPGEGASFLFHLNGDMP